MTLGFLENYEHMGKVVLVQILSGKISTGYEPMGNAKKDIGCGVHSTKSYWCSAEHQEPSGVSRKTLTLMHQEASCSQQVMGGPWLGKLVELMSNSCPSYFLMSIGHGQESRLEHLHTVHPVHHQRSWM